MRIALACLFAVTLAGCAGLLTPPVTVTARPEGLEIALQGYRFLLSGRHEVRIETIAAGEGFLYRVDGHEIRVRPERGVVLDGRPLDLQPGELHRLPPPAAGSS